MNRANLDAAIAAKQKEIDLNRDQILKLLEKDTDLCYELEELKDEMQNND